MPVAFPEPRAITANGIELAVHEQGDGPAVVLCHGFPELAYSWRHQLPALATAGYRALAPDQRGYGASSRPAAVAAYDMAALTGDLVGLLDTLEIDRAVFCGHDWGGLVVWQMPLRHPDRVAGVIALNTPYRPRPPIEPIAACRRVFGDAMYIVRFQEPGLADALFDRDPARSMRFFLRKAAPGDRAWRRWLDPRHLDLMTAFARPEREWPGELVVDEEDIARFAGAFEKTGFTGPLNWYRNFTRNWELAEGQGAQVEVPCLMISAADDFFLPPQYAEGMEEFCPDLERHVIPDCGHWTQQEQPAAVNRLMVDWLTRRFPAPSGPPSSK